MKSFKDFKKYLSEEYYDGPTAYAAGGNIGDIGGMDRGHMGAGSQQPYPTNANKRVLEASINADLGGAHLDPVTAIARARANLNSTGFSFDLDVNQLRLAAEQLNPYESAMNFGGHPLGEAPDNNPADDFAAREIGIVDQEPIEKTLPEYKVVFDFEPAGTGYKINATLKD